MTQEKRRHERFSVPMELQVTYNSETILCSVHDFSSSGVYISGHFSTIPKVGELAILQVVSPDPTIETPTLHARIIRNTDSGIAFEFIPPEEES